MSQSPMPSWSVATTPGSRGGSSQLKRGNTGLPWDNQAEGKPRRRPKLLPPTTEEVVTAVAKLFGVSPQQSPAEGMMINSKRLAIPRRAARYLLRVTTGMRHEQIGPALGFADHSPVTSRRAVRWINLHPKLKELLHATAREHGWPINEFKAGVPERPRLEEAWTQIVDAVAFYFDIEDGRNVTGVTSKYDPYKEAKFVARWLAAHTMRVQWRALAEILGLIEEKQIRHADERVDADPKLLRWAQHIAARRGWKLYQRPANDSHSEKWVELHNPVGADDSVREPKPKEDPTTKCCTRCNRTIPLSQFPHSVRTLKAGRQKQRPNSYCLDCKAIYDMEYHVRQAVGDTWKIQVTAPRTRWTGRRAITTLTLSGIRPGIKVWVEGIGDGEELSPYSHKWEVCWRESDGSEGRVVSGTRKGSLEAAAQKYVELARLGGKQREVRG